MGKSRRRDRQRKKMKRRMEKRVDFKDDPCKEGCDCRWAPEDVHPPAPAGAASAPTPSTSPSLPVPHPPPPPLTNNGFSQNGSCAEGVMPKSPPPTTPVAAGAASAPAAAPSPSLPGPHPLFIPPPTPLPLNYEKFRLDPCAEGCMCGRPPLTAPFTVGAATDPAAAPSPSPSLPVPHPIFFFLPPPPSHIPYKLNFEAKAYNNLLDARKILYAKDPRIEMHCRTFLDKTKPRSDKLIKNPKIGDFTICPANLIRLNKWKRLPRNRHKTKEQLEARRKKYMKDEADHSEGRRLNQFVNGARRFGYMGLLKGEEKNGMLCKSIRVGKK